MPHSSNRSGNYSPSRYSGAHYRPSASTPVGIITMQFGGSLVFVKRPETYQEALDIATKEFSELAHMSEPNRRLGFSMNNTSREGQEVRISESAWPVISAHFPGGTIVNVLVLPDRETLPPKYDTNSLAPPEDSRYLKLRGVASSPSLRSDSKKKHFDIFPFSWIGVGK